MSRFIDALGVRAAVEALADADLVHQLSDAAALAGVPREIMPALRAIGLPRLAAMIADPTGEVAAWAARMAVQHESPTVRIHPGTDFGYDVDWATALMIVWLGEAPLHWPTTWPAEAIARAAVWESGAKIPQHVGGAAPRLLGTLTAVEA